MWQKAHVFVLQVYDITKPFPKDLNHIDIQTKTNLNSAIEEASKTLNTYCKKILTSLTQ